MKKVIAKLAVAGVMAVGTVAGTAATASAHNPAHWTYAYGWWSTPKGCEDFVRANGEWGVWDCETSDWDGHWWAFTP